MCLIAGVSYFRGVLLQVCILLKVCVLHLLQVCGLSVNLLKGVCVCVVCVCVCACACVCVCVCVCMR